MNMIKKGKPIIFGDGLNKRSMTYVHNLVDGMLMAANKKSASGQTYWIADEKPYRTIEIYLTIAEILGVEIKPRFIPGIVSGVMEKADAVLGKMGKYSTNIHVAGEMDQDIACSIEKAKSELGYAPKVGLEEGMRRSIEWCRQNNQEI